MNVFDYFFEKSRSETKNFILGNKETISYPELQAKSYALSQLIVKQYGEHNNILLLCPNSVYFIVVYLAIFKSGNVCVPLNQDIEPHNLEFIVKKCNAHIAFISENKQYDVLSSSFNIYTEKILDSLPNTEHAEVSESIDFDAERMAEIIFTSGSTGEPKGVMISHMNIIANTNSIIKYLKLTSKDIMEVVMPFYYCYGLSLFHTHLRVGGSIVLNNTFMFLGSVINDLKKYNCTGFAGVPSHFQMLLRKTKNFKTTDFPALRYVTQAGGKLHNTFILEFISAFPSVLFYVMYGQTEATARLSYLQPDLLPEKVGSIGKGIPDVELKVVDADNQKVGMYEVGEIIASGKNIMLGYLGDEQSTNNTLRNSWLHTGDLGKYDKDGFIYLTARKKEIIKVGGKRISPKEIEEVIVAIPNVVDCSIEATEDDLLGEGLKAIVVVPNLKNNELTREYLQKECAKKLAPFKVPGIVEFIDKFVVSSTGKKVKAKL